MEKEKIVQSIQILKELDIDLWLVVDRESGLMADPVMDYVVGSEVTWLSFFMFFKNGAKYAIVGNLDVERIERKGLFDEVKAYKGSPKEMLLELLNRHRPIKIALNYSVDSPAADGLTYGRYLSLLELLKDTGYSSAFVSAEPIISRLRGRKSPDEVHRLQAAITHTEDILKRVARWVKPGMAEKSLAELILRETEKKGLKTAWERGSCPSVFFGPQKVGAHSGPTENKLQRGQVFNIDFGVQFDKYCSDLQRTWYVMNKGETRIPGEVEKAFATIVKSIELSFAALKPGVQGVDIDAVARNFIVSQGYEEYPHALGHQVGRDAHDGGGLLAPVWERYGNLPFIQVEAGQVYTIEPRINLKDYGVVTVEEMVWVTESGVQFISHPQKNIWIVK